MKSRRRMRLMVAGACLLSMGAVTPGATAAEPDRQVPGGPAQPEPRKFIVTLADDVGDPAAVAIEHSSRHGAEVSYLYRHALRGYAATLSERGLSAVAGDARVVRVEPDGPVSASETQNPATWGLDRIDQRAPSPANGFSYTSSGAGVKAYVIDSGMHLTHREFAGRVLPGFDAVDGGSADDCNGHGTHVAGTVGSTTYGVAKAVSLVPVRVLDCTGNGSWSGVIAGVDWVTGDHQPNAPAVANMSLIGGANATVDTAVRSSIADGVSYAIAAGNGNSGGVGQDACKYSPARVGEAMTIGSTDSTDRKASSSNFGNCVDWFAPGVNITSAWHTGDSATNTISGTSMATPHTAGVVALYLQGNPTASPASVRSAVFNRTTKSVVKSSKSTNNHLLFTDL